MSDGRVVFDVVADNSTVPGTIQDTTNKLTSAAQQWQGQMDKAGKTGLSFDSIAQGLGLSLGTTLAGALKNAGAAALNFAKESISVASDLAEVQNVVDVTFEDSASVINNWAKKASSAYGLTELQAKRYTSTLGAMMKSSGLASDSISGMATELAGLTADMASFYNLDFDTAFEKIRSGISGETEPLKQLGINMSVANLNAFALSQGIQKTFDKMSQSEQIMIRYQYLMQATADAQGDFARTSDGYANSVRRIETAWESIKASVGTLILGPLSEATNSVATFLEKVTAKPPKTVMEQIAEIDIDTSKQIAQIEATAQKAQNLVSTLEGIATTSSGLENSSGKVKGLLDNLSEGIDTASTSAKNDAGATEGYLSKLTEAVGSVEKADPENNAPGYLKSLGGAMESVKIGINGVSQAVTADNGATAGYLGTINETLRKEYETPQIVTRLGELSDAVGTATEKTANGSGINSFLTNLANALGSNKVSDSKAKNWQTLLNTLMNNIAPLSAVIGEDAGQTTAWLESLQTTASSLGEGTAEQWESLFNTLEGKIPGLRTALSDGGFLEGLGILTTAGKDIENAQAAVAGVSDNAQEAAVKQRQWLDTCRALVNEIPGLSTIIDTETGAIKGGLDAVRAYITEWESGQKRLAYVKAQAKKQEVLDAAFEDLIELEVSVILDDKGLDKAKKELDDLRKKLVDLGAKEMADGLLDFSALPLGTELDLEINRFNELWVSVNNLTDANTKLHESYEQRLSDYNEAQAALEQENEALGIVEQTTEGAANATDGYAGTVDEATSALDKLSSALEGVAKYEGEVLDRTTKTVERTVDGFEKLETKTELTAEQIKANLASQTQWISDYMAGLEELKQKGAGADLLAFLSDGTEESANAVLALRGASEEDIKAISAQYTAIEQQKQVLSKELTKNQLSGDDVYGKLLEEMKTAVDEMDMSATAGANVGNTVQAMIDAINVKHSGLSAAVTSIKTLMSELESMGLGGGLFLNGSFASGLDYVPFDGFVAELHQGEMILTAEEAAQFRNWGLSREAATGVDYDALSNAISGSVPDGSAAVYMDGEIVGRMVSRSQGNSYRQLERSGWR